ncbi:hypothetical protein NK553_26860 [Pseudomonas sp. ZM23]|uniref:Serine kinase/phosphatase n=1 Tax=Pseudomonas triclosanedens TaxID=2961893 RepID=A0ABY7A8F3_9PSED|nr:hypothetical protein [Pseudomonas triclosanedens]MCP8467580.1 hypothetical protein [Pseudomonas triclosanedens]MCP8471757.1 hypothetical protein [Pseudomonas triclosanedens]MCP8478890.1 hypothetical protein [Pseudomonas triclosanedens]WAI52374.1 hypothetical protein OU419_14325 [Pseudomonas triclosanedens]
MKNPHDLPEPDPVVTREDLALDDLIDLDTEDGDQQPHLSAAHQEGLIDSIR